MIRALAASLALGGLLALPAGAQQYDDEPDENAPPVQIFPDVDAAVAGQVAEAPAAILRGLDKRVGDVTDLALAKGDTVALGRLQVTLGECRYPRDNPSGDAFAYLVIRQAGEDRPVFQGWMIASAPALSALEHPRYDIWVMRCTT
ncbi:hypothetical protein OCGS_0602 [Oceaniovalibus guishaninsula JLT2003]|uniref:DUF2155 domain-containing protein n=2 Tax=Oceaniovalibus TaxID=1207070 RepID=K2HGD3_9RHOB|nr:hypothetical protein OCGS_0602 [Oceaniovalibus guishaninsula JLT2003]